MNPKIDITITDSHGDYAMLVSDNFEPYEVYVNNERFCTSEQLEELELENAKLRELALKNWYIALSEYEALTALNIYDICPDGIAYMAALDDKIITAKDCMRELGIEVSE